MTSVLANADTATKRESFFSSLVSLALFLTPPLIISLAISFSPFNAHSAVQIISTRQAVRPADGSCGSSSTCDLQDVRFEEMKKKVTFPGESSRYASYLTDTRFAYTVEAREKIESYGIVQFIRGCMYESRLINGRVEKYLTIDREHFGKTKTFQHREWEVDSDNDDPLYSSYAGVGRFALLRWNENPNSLDPETSTWYANAKPPHGSVFVTDLPGSAALNAGPNGKDTSARNASLEFKTCFFRIQDLPRTTTPRGADIDLSKALWCVNWDHKFVHDFAQKKMTTPSTIDPICAVR